MERADTVAQFCFLRVAGEDGDLLGRGYGTHLLQNGLEDALIAGVAQALGAADHNAAAVIHFSLALFFHGWSFLASAAAEHVII